MWSTLGFRDGLSGFHAQNKESLSRAAYLLDKHAGKSFSRAMGNAFRQTIAGIFAKPHMNTSSMLEGHIASTVSRCQSSTSSRIIVPQDTTYYNYSGHVKMEGLKPIQGNVKGIIQHNALAVEESGIPLGLLYQHNWTRGGAHDFENESTKWFEGLKAVNKHATAITKPIVVVQDREADIFTFFQAPRASNVDLLVRIHQPRKLETVEDQQVAKLAQTAESLPQRGLHKVWIRRNNKDVELTLVIGSAQVNVFPGKDLSPERHKVRGLSLVVAREVSARDKHGKDCSKPEAPSQWLLLTSLEAETLEQACQVVDYYAMRWSVERFHFVLKSGSLKVEKLQFDDVLTTCNALAFYSIVAWRILYLTLSARKTPDERPEAHFSPLEIKVLQTKHPKADQSLYNAVLALGKLVNFVTTSKQPLPGVKIMAEGFAKLYTITQALQEMYDDPLQD